nr:MAG TPA: hypothetical protein [Caudoviricetes sp.]
MLTISFILCYLLSTFYYITKVLQLQHIYDII